MAEAISPHVCVFCLIYWSTCLFGPCSILLFVTIALQYFLKSGMTISPVLFFLVRIVVAIQDLYWLHVNIRDFFLLLSRMMWSP